MKEVNLINNKYMPLQVNCRTILKKVLMHVIILKLNTSVILMYFRVEA